MSGPSTSVRLTSPPPFVGCFLKRETKTAGSRTSVTFPRCDTGRVAMQLQPLNDGRVLPRLSSSGPLGLGSQLMPFEKKRPAMNPRGGRLAVVSSAMSARCSQGQTQTVTREAPTITRAPVHEKEKSPELDDGGSGFPPRDDGDGGGGGGGGGGNFSGGFFLFGFLAFLGFLKDKESDQGDYRSSRRR